MKQSLLSRYGAHGGTVEKKHLPPAVEEVVQHHHVNRIIPVIVREDHEVHVEQSILPIIENLEEEGDVQERTQAPSFREVHHDMPQDLVSKRMQNRQAMVDIGRNITEDDTQETVEDEPIVEHRRYIHQIVRGTAGHTQENSEVACGPHNRPSLREELAHLTHRRSA